MRKDNVRTGASSLAEFLIAVMVVYAIVASKGHGTRRKKIPLFLIPVRPAAAGDSTGKAERLPPGRSRDDRSDADLSGVTPA